MRPCGFELLDDGQQVADRARQAIKPDHHQGFAGTDIAQQAGEHRPAAIGAGGVFFEDGGATGGAQFIELRIGPLLVCGDARVADQAAYDGGFAGLCRRHVDSSSSGARFYNSTRCLETTVCRRGRMFKALSCRATRCLFPGVGHSRALLAPAICIVI